MHAMLAGAAAGQRGGRRVVHGGLRLLLQQLVFPRKTICQSSHRTIEIRAREPVDGAGLQRRLTAPICANAAFPPLTSSPPNPLPSLHGPRPSAKSRAFWSGAGRRTGASRPGGYKSSIVIVTYINDYAPSIVRLLKSMGRALIHKRVFLIDSIN